MEETIPAVPVRIKTGLKIGLHTSFKLLCFILPFYVVVQLFKDSPFVRSLANLFAPFMGLFGLPGEAAFAFVVGGLVNIYGAIAILATLDLSPWQVTQCGLMLGLAHELVVEGGVMRSTGMRAGLFTVVRLLLALSVGLLFYQIHRFFGEGL
jgi:hypothetical protein